MWQWATTWLALEAEWLRFCAFWSFFALLGVLEALFPAMPHSAERSQRWPTNLGLGLVNMAIVPLAPVTTIAATEWAHTARVGLFNVVEAPWWMAALATLSMCSLASYGVHLLMHKVPLLWKVHRVHHLDTHLDVSTTLRSHPLEIAVKILVLVPISIVFGLTPVVVIAYQMIEGLVDAFSHANVELPHQLDRSLRWLLITPNMHSIHHSSYQPETDSNYGQVFSVWDRLFGTYTAEANTSRRHREVGLREIRDQRTASFWWQLKSPLLHFPRRASRIDSAQRASIRRPASDRIQEGAG
jgi:sterol desaturase/sphingolipid hydroxylase (fatty acid hydroxylase superfamily)